MNFVRNNHYISESYLRRWSVNNQVLTYALLVPNPNVPLWKVSSIRSTGSKNDLYTATTFTNESDAIERWFNIEIESPASAAIEKALNHQKMTPEDWHRIIRFYALHETRSPSSFFFFLKRWSESGQAILREAMEIAVERIKGNSLYPSAEISMAQFSPLIPIPAGTAIEKQTSQSYLKTELVIGRELWLNSIQGLLTSTYKHLLDHKWTLLKCHPDLCWPTTDHPAICTRNGSYLREENGPGWATKDAELFMPLDPKHLLYTKVGNYPSQKGSTLSFSESKRLKNLLLHRAHQYIYSSKKIEGIEAIKPRLVCLDAYQKYQSYWADFHNKNSTLIKSLPPPMETK